MKPSKLPIIAFAIFSILASSCTKQSIRIFKSNSAREQYINTLQGSGINETKIGKEWEEKGNTVLSTAPLLDLPFAIQGSFKAKSIEANAWKIILEQGESISIEVNWQPVDSSRLIVDLLESPEGKEIESELIQLDSLHFEADNTGEYVIRIQPELLGEGNYQIVVNGTQTYAVFPVMGKKSAAIQSFWGAERDGGARSHEGVDIFAPRGTPVLAPIAGIVTAVRDRGLGGKQVWLRDNERNWRLYFAHLDSQTVDELQRVNPGDTLGLVGNTGNARTTAPHLHFGIYQNGAINPLPAIRTDFQTASPLPDQQYSTMMSSISQANLRDMPNTRSTIITTLPAKTPVFILGGTADWYQIRTVNGLTGFISKSLISELSPISLRESSAYALHIPSFSSADSLLVNLDQFSKIGTFDNFDVIIDKDENILYLPSDRQRP